MKILVASGFLILGKNMLCIPEKDLADLFYVSVGRVNAILKTWCILINSVFMRHFFKYP
jgi:hypothetical protein